MASNEKNEQNNRSFLDSLRVAGEGILRGFGLGTAAWGTGALEFGADTLTEGPIDALGIAGKKMENGSKAMADLVQKDSGNTAINWAVAPLRVAGGAEALGTRMASLPVSAPSAVVEKLTEKDPDKGVDLGTDWLIKNANTSIVEKREELVKNIERAGRAVDNFSHASRGAAEASANAAESSLAATMASSDAAVEIDKAGQKIDALIQQKDDIAKMKHTTWKGHEIAYKDNNHDGKFTKGDEYFDLGEVHHGGVPNAKTGGKSGHAKK